MALPNEKFEEIKSKIQQFIDNEMVVHEDDFNINHKFADHLSFLEEKRNLVRDMIICASNSKRVWRIRIKSSSTRSNL